MTPLDWEGDGEGIHLQLVLVGEVPMVVVRFVNDTEDLTVHLHLLDAGRLAVALRDIVAGALSGLS